MRWKLASGVVAGLLLLGAVWLVSGCDSGQGTTPVVPGPPPPEPEPGGIVGSRVRIGNGVELNILPNEHRRVLIQAKVCMREGPLELLLTRANQKEHEAILTAAVDASDVKKALLLTGAKEGSVVQYEPEFKPPTGGRVRVSLIYEQDGKPKEVAARMWVRNATLGRELEYDWVFAGSLLFVNEDNPTGPKRLEANDGTLIAVANVPSALLDLPVQSLKGLEERSYEAWTARIPPPETPVTVVLDPVIIRKK